LFFFFLLLLLLQIIDGVTVELELGGEWIEEISVPCGPLATNVSGMSFVCLARPADAFALEPSTAVLKYTTTFFFFFFFFFLNEKNCM
jgi:hypothetical protein